MIASAGAGRVVVELSVTACTRCARGRGCGAALFSHAGGAPRLNCVVPTDAPSVFAGERVAVDIDRQDGRWLHVVMLVYALPTAGLLGGALLPEPWTPFAALGGALGGVLAWRLPGASRLLDAVAGPCPTSARIVTIDPQEPRCQES